MPASLNRRKFLGSSAGLIGFGCLEGPGSSLATTADAQTADDANWNFSLLGDLHFDRLEHHDFDWVKREQPNDLRQIENYSHIAEHNLPALMHKVKQTIAANRCTSVVQLGDLVEGLCGSEKLARQHCRDAVEFFKDLNPGVPVRVTKGNHDITGPGSVAAYNDVVMPWVAEGLQQAPDALAAHFTIEQNRDLFVYFDAYDSASLDWFEALVKSRDPASGGRLFFVVHPPVVAYNARSAWCLFGKQRDREKRERLYQLLGRHRAIVLCGHLHKYAFVERETPAGSFTQLAVSSIAYHLDDQPEDLISGVEFYGPDLVDLEPRHSPETVAERRAILEREKPFIRRYDYGNFWGHAVIKVSPGKVEADIYQLLDEQPWKTITLA